jgi:hypothetical protein
MMSEQTLQAVFNVRQVRHHLQARQTERWASFQSQQVANASAEILNEAVS